VNRRFIRIGRPIHSYSLGLQYVDISHHERPGGKVIAALGGHLPLGGWAIVTFATYLHGKDGSAIQELAACPWADVVCRVGAERFPVRQVYNKALVVPVGPAHARPPRMGVQGDKDFITRAARQIPGWRYEPKFSVDDLGLAIFRHMIEVFD